MARGVLDGETHTSQLQLDAVDELAHVVGLDERGLAAQPPEQRPRVGRQPGHRVGEQVPVGGVDPGGGVVRAGQRRDRPDVVDVAVGGHHRDRLEPLLGNDLRDTWTGVLAGVDDHALAARAGRHHPAVGAPRTCGESGDEHGRQRTAACCGGSARRRDQRLMVARSAAPGCAISGSWLRDQRLGAHQRLWLRDQRPSGCAISGPRLHDQRPTVARSAAHGCTISGPRLHHQRLAVARSAVGGRAISGFEAGRPGHRRRGTGPTLLRA